MVSTLRPNPRPLALDVAELGTLYVTGQVSGLGLGQTHAVEGDRGGRFDISEGQVELQKPDGLVQFYVQAGLYSIPGLGAAYTPAREMTRSSYGHVPVAYLKLAPSEHFSVQAGKLPSLIGAEYTFSFQNMNIASGLLWNQEPAISRGVQLNYGAGRAAVSVSLSDGYYSNRLTTGSAMVSYAATPRDTVAVVAHANFKRAPIATFATPLAQGNGAIFNLIWTHSAGRLTLVPYAQYNRIPRARTIGLPSPAASYGAALLASYRLNSRWVIGSRAEYLATTGKDVNLLVGPGSRAWSATVTPTWQKGTLFLRAEASFTRAQRTQAGAAFGRSGDRRGQARVIFESGVLF